jgi:hypothetical protein
MSYNDLHNLNYHYTGRIRCYLCEAPKYKWAIKLESGEFVCRCCINFEGPERVGYAVSYAQYMKKRFTERHEPHIPCPLFINTRTTPTIPQPTPAKTLRHTNQKSDGNTDTNNYMCGQRQHSIKY